MQVVALEPAGTGFAWCECAIAGAHRRQRLNILWLEELAVGDWVFAFQGVARQRLTPQRASEIAEALAELAAAMENTGQATHHERV